MSVEADTCAQISTFRKDVLLKMIPVTLRVGDREYATTAMLDSGSTVTMVRADIARELGASGPVKPLCIQWGDGSQVRETDSQVIDVQVRGNYRGAPQYTMRGVKTVRSMPQHKQTVNKTKLIQMWPYLRDVRRTSAAYSGRIENAHRMGRER